MNYILGLVWIVVLVLIYFLFEKVCQYGFDKTAIETLKAWWQNGSGKWIVIVSAACLLVQSFIVQDVVTKLYALLSGSTEQRILAGKGLNNELYYVARNNKIETSFTDIYDQQNFFADSFKDVHQPDTVLRYGKKTSAIYQAGALRVNKFLLSYVFIAGCTLFAGLGFLVVLGVNAKIATPGMFTAETDFLIGWKWMLHHFKTSLFLTATILFALAVGIALLARYQHGVKFETVRKGNSNPLPENLKRGMEIEGMVLGSVNHIVTSNYTGEKVISSKRKVYRNYLVEFKQVYKNPVRLRFTVYTDNRTKQWMSETADLENRKMKFVVVEDMAIWPKALFDKGITPVTN